MIYLIGCEHFAQRKVSGAELSACQLAFRWTVQCAIESVQPAAVAEGDHRDFLWKKHPGSSSREPLESILESIAGAQQPKIKHRFVDANEAEREEIGYRRSGGPDIVQPLAHEIVHHFPKREEFWLRKLEDLLNNETDVLFICGWGHIESFRELLTSRGIESSVLATGIGATPETLQIDVLVRNYIKNHSAEFNRPSCPCQT